MSRAKKKVPPRLHVVFDSSVIHTDVAHALLRSEARSFIESNSGHTDLEVHWHLPQTVIDERRHQMRERAGDLVPTLGKLEALLGHNLGISEEILSSRIDETIDSQMAGLGIKSLPLITKDVEWGAIVESAVFRKPPFSPGKSEKGFRDAVIVESFLQLVAKSPSTPSVCRLAIVTNDDLMQQHARARTSNEKNVRVLSDIGELESLVNTLVAAVTEEFVAEIAEKAQNYFFQKGDETTLYYKEDIASKIQQKFSAELASFGSINANRRDSGTWWISKPVFDRKVKQRVYWSTPIEVDAKLIRFQYPSGTDLESSLVEIPYLPDITSSSVGSNPFAQSIISGSASETDPLAGLALTLGSKEVEVASGKTHLNVLWSVSVSAQKRNLSAPRIEEITCAGTKWNTDD